MSIEWLISNNKREDKDPWKDAEYKNWIILTTTDSSEFAFSLSN
jgi:hypothetical protein